MVPKANREFAGGVSAANVGSRDQSVAASAVLLSSFRRVIGDRNIGTSHVSFP